LQDEPIADNVCIPLYFLARLVKQSGTTVVQVGEGADENFLGYWWCEHYRQKYESVYKPRSRDRDGGRRFAPEPRRLPLASAVKISRSSTAQGRARSCSGAAAVCWWGDMRKSLTPSAAPFSQAVECPVEGLMPHGHTALDSHAVVREYLGGLTGHLPRTGGAPENSLHGDEAPAAGASADARRQAHDGALDRSTRAVSRSRRRRVRDQAAGVLQAAARRRQSLLKKAAAPYLDEDLVYRKKQGFGAPMEEWFQEGDFGARCLAAFERSALVKDGFFDKAYFVDLLKGQMAGRGGYSFQIWTVMNAVLWHASWVEGREDCL